MIIPQTNSEKRKIIEAIIFSAPAAISLESLNKFFEEDVSPLIQEIKDHFEKEHGIDLIIRDNKFIMLTKKSFAGILKNFWGLEERELSQATLEVLAIIAYAGPVSRNEINKIRGVNSNYIINKLLLRGFISRGEGSNKKYLKLSDDFKNFLGIIKEEELPNYDEIRKQLKEK